MASALKMSAGAMIRAQARSAWLMAWTSGWFWLFVPSRFHTKAIASRRMQSAPWLARNPMMSANSTRTSGFDQLTSHCHSLKVVQTQPSIASSNVKLPGAKAGKISGSDASYASGISRSGNT